jgi:hypothetical protein
MTEPVDYPAHETALDKPVVAPAQAAVDATFNAFTNGGVVEVEHRLRAELADAGVDVMPDHWVSDVAARISSGEPVVVEVEEDAPPQ